MTSEDVKMRLISIRNVTNDLELLSINNIKMFFNNLLCVNNHFERLKTSYSNCDIHTNSECYNIIENLINSSDDEEYCIDKLRTFIIEGNYIITLRKNVFFIVKRNLFTEVSKLGITYGTYMSESNPYWWNSESQLQEICKLNKITVFDSTTVLEDKSLYEYSRNNYINENTYDIFINNTKYNQNKIIIQRGLSIDILTKLEKIYDFVYIDGDHSEKAVWIDAIYSFKILRNNGIIIFDDYEWNQGDKSPKNAIDRFLNEYKDHIEVISINYQVVVRKLSDL